MNIGVISEEDAKFIDILAVFTYKDVVNKYGNKFPAYQNRKFFSGNDYYELQNFKAEAGSVLTAWSDTLPLVLLIGLGERWKDCRVDNFRNAAALLPKYLKELSQKTNIRTENIGAILPDEDSSAIQSVVEGLMNGLYEFKEFKTKKDINPLEINNFYILCDKSSEVVSLLEPSVKAGQIIAAAVHLARDLGNTPSNILTPAQFANTIRQLSVVDYSSVDIFNDDCLEKMGMNAILAVGAGSENVPHLTVLKYCPPGDLSFKQKIILVGKGLTFDSGGVSIKPSRGMEKMKFDMAGAATVLAVVKAAADLKLPIPVIAVMPFAENILGSSAIKPGSIIKSYSGKTIEIISTDAEGRLLLADACSYAIKRFKPSIIITIATLTGACITAAGNAAAGLMGNDPLLVAQLKKSGEVVGEKVQIFELFPEYKEQLKSDVADIKNMGGREAETITAAMFVEEFLKMEDKETPKWAHFDIASTAYTQSQTPKKNYYSPGATGWGVRLLIEFLRRSA